MNIKQICEIEIYNGRSPFLTLILLILFFLNYIAVKCKIKWSVVGWRVDKISNEKRITMLKNKWMMRSQIQKTEKG